MTHDHAAVQLAVASLDFELTPAERSRMEAGLAECPECAAIAAQHVEMYRLLERLPIHDASQHVRQRVMRAALVPPRTRQWQVLLVAAALFGLLLAAAVAAGAFRSDPLDPITDVSPPSPPALGDVVSPEPSASTDPLASPPDPGGGSVFGDPLQADSIAEVVSGRLRIRSEPRVADDSVKYEPLLDVGARLMILDGPVVANDYEWYHVAAWDRAHPDTVFPAGWVSRGDHDGTPWISAAMDVCPGDTITTADVVALTPAERVACFGDRELRLRAYVSGSDEIYPCDADPGCLVDGPAWLTNLGGAIAEVDARDDARGQPGAPIAIEPGGRLKPDVLPYGSMAEIVGSFDHPAAQDCQALQGAASARTTDARARLDCRATFVVTSLDADRAYPVRGPGITVSDRLRVRSAPGLESERFELLAKGTPVWVVDGPITSADYEWFRVIVPGLEIDGVPRVGWVAESDHGGERWLARRTVKCPSPGNVTVAELARLMRQDEPHGGLACFGDGPITFDAEVDMSCGESRPTWQVEPEWLGPHAFHTLALTRGTDVINAHMRPDLGVPESCGGIDPAMRTIRGHFDDADAETCTGPAPSGTSATDAEVLIRYWCRTALVVDDIEPMPPLVGP